MERKGISGSTLKIIAIVAMAIDHIGAAIVARMLISAGMNTVNQADSVAMSQWMVDNGTLYEIYMAMRFIGRIAFPIFCFLLIQGFEHTRDRKKYALRLLAFVLISEIPFDLAFSSRVLEFQYQNVFFTLFIGLLVMMLSNYIENKDSWHVVIRIFLCGIVTAAGMGAAELLRTDYGAIGIFCIMILYYFRKSKIKQIVAGCIAFLWEITAPLAFIPIAFYNGKRGWNMKYVFYIFYPAHLLIIYLICVAMGTGSIPAV